MKHTFLLSLFVASSLVGGCSGPTAVQMDAGSDAAVVFDTGLVDSSLPTSDGGIDAASPTDAASTVDASGDAGMCPVPPVLGHSGDTCSPAAETCPTGYTCHPFSGVVLNYSCEILCEPDGCPCPSGSICGEHADKGGSWHQCDEVDG